MKIWAKCIRNHKTVLSQVQDFDLAPVYDVDTWSRILSEFSRPFDISSPVILSKNLNELKSFGRTVFRKEDFIDEFQFDQLELEIIREKKKI